MSTAIATIPTSTMAVAEQYLESFGNKLTKEHRNQFLHIASAFNLNPFIREIYGVPFDDKFNIIVGYEVYLKRAENSGVLDGWRAWTEGTMIKKTITKTLKKKDGGTWNKEVEIWEGDLKACIEIYRKDRSRPFYHEVYFSEYNQENSMWGSKPRTMIKKVAIAQGFRLAFPVELGGIPYTADELPGNNVAPEVVAPEPPPVQKLESIKQPLIDTISRETAGSISNDLKRANIHPADLFESFGITRLGELKLTQIEDVFAWIAGKAIIPEPVIDAQMDNDAGWPDPPELKKAA